MVGALLVIAAAVGVFVAASDAGVDPTRPYVVATDDLAVGTVLSEAHLTTARLDLSAPVDQRAFHDPTVLVGHRVVAPLGEGDLVQQSAVSASPQDGPRNELTFAVGASRALDGRLAAGDRIDVYVTLDGSTRTVARDVPLLDAPVERGRGDLVLRVGLADERTVLHLIDAVNRGEVTVVRSTHADNPPGDLSTRDDAEPPRGALDDEPDG